MVTDKMVLVKTITAWDEAVPLGNGDIGCLIWNEPTKLRFSIDKSGIWDCSDSPENQEGFNYENLKNLVAKKRLRKLSKIFDDCYSKVTPTKLPTGKLILDLKTEGNVVSQLDFRGAEATLKVGDVVLKSFVHAKENYGYITINKTNVGYKLESPSFGDKNDNKSVKSKGGITTDIKQLKYGKSENVTKREGDVEISYFIQRTNDICYGIVLAKLEAYGKTNIAYTVGMANNEMFVGDSISIVKKAVVKQYNEAIFEHKKWWLSYFNKSSICIEDKALEKQWYYNNYLFASCSRKGNFPMPLQGVWTADNDNLPPWKGDYHHDLNTQMSYCSYLKVNHIDEGESFIDFLLNMSFEGERFAKQFYGLSGLCLPSVMDIKGHALGGWAQYSLSPTNQLWLCDIMTKHFNYTGDLELLKNKIYPYMVKAGEFLLNLLVVKNSKYKLPLSSSPEIFDNSKKAWLKPNSNYDLALMRAFMQDMVELSQTLGYEQEAAFWKEKLTKLEPLAVGKDNVLLLAEKQPLKKSHRHLSHCMAIYPLRTMRYDCQVNKQIIDSTIENIENLGIGQWVGYTFGWLANLYTVQGNGEKASKILHDFFNYFCTDNGFHSNGDYRNKTACNFKYRHFTLEANFLALDAISNMLLYSERDGLKLFPAIPKTWQNAEFNNLRGFGGILVSAKMSSGKIEHFTVFSPANTKIKLLNASQFDGNIPSELDLTAGKIYSFKA